MPVLHNGARHKEPEATFEWADTTQAEIPAQSSDGVTSEAEILAQSSAWRCI